jgi:hypothetical protein
MVDSDKINWGYSVSTSGKTYLKGGNFSKAVYPHGRKGTNNDVFNESPQQLGSVLNDPPAGC